MPAYFRSNHVALSYDWFGLLGFMAYQPLLVIQHQIPFYANNQFHFKQFSLAWVPSLIVKNISISNYSSSYI